MENKELLLENLSRRGFIPHIFATKEEAAAYLLSEIQGKTVGIGGCQTAEQMGLYEKLCEKNTVTWHWKDKSPDARRRANAAEVYISGVNALALTGELVNIDGAGNRVAATLFGPKKLYIVTGENKLAPTLEQAIWRARNIASPLNARRLGKKTPCALSEELRCYDCSSPERICCGMVITMEKPMSMESVEIIIIEEELGY